MFEDVSNYPLAWPSFWPRTKPIRRTTAPFEEHTLAEARDYVMEELRRLGAKTPIISTNIPLRQDGLLRSGRIRVDDPGVAVYFILSGEPRVLACDKWSQVVDNLWAVAKHIEAMRGQQRWGVGTLEQAFAGYARLPESTTANWWQVLGVERGAGIEQIRESYRALVKQHHPDAGGSQDAFLRIQQAWEQAQKEKGGVQQ